MNTERQKIFLIKAGYIAVVAGIVYLAFKLLSGMLFPFAAAVFLAVALQPFIRKWSCKLKLKKKAASVVLIVVIYAVIGGLLSWLIYTAYRELTGLINMLPDYASKISEALSGIGGRFKSFSDRMPTAVDGMFGGISEATLNSVTEKAAAFIAGKATGIAATVPYFLLSLFVMIFASAYFAKDYDEICRFVKNKLPEGSTAKITKMKKAVLHNIYGMLKGYFLILAMTFTELVIGLTILKCRYSVVIAAVTAIIDILPVFGSGSVLIPWAAYAAFSGNTKIAVGLAVLYIVITVIRSITEPKIIGHRAGVHPLIMLAAMFFGLKIFGTAGIILLPVAVIAAKSCIDCERNKSGLSDEEIILRKRKTRIILSSKKSKKKAKAQ